MKTIGLQLRFLLPLAAALVVTVYLAVPLVDQVTPRWFGRDLNTRSQLLASAMSDSVGAERAVSAPQLGPALLQPSISGTALAALPAPARHILGFPDARSRQKSMLRCPTLGVHALPSRCAPLFMQPPG